MTTSILFFAWNVVAVCFFMFALAGLTYEYLINKNRAAQKVRADIDQNSKVNGH